MAAPPPVTWPTINHDAGSLTGTTTGAGIYTATPVFDIRNGSPADARSIFIRPTIAPSYHWVPIADLDPRDAMECFDAFVRSATAQLAAHPVANLTEGQRRKVALCLGVSRAVMTAYYSLLPGDMVAGEMAQAKLKVTVAANGDKSFTPRTNLSADEKALLRQATEYSTTESAAISALIASSVGIPPLQGYSLVVCQHHYMSNAESQSKKAFLAVEKQFWKGKDVADWFAQDAEVIQDALWHKSGHPIIMSLKEMLAFDIKVANMLVTAGAGSAAARLPAVETDARAAGAYKNLFATCKALFEVCDGDVDYSIIEVALDTLNSFPVNVDNENRPPGLPNEVPLWVNTRANARAWLKDVVERNAPSAAMCFGFYCSLTDSSQTLGTNTGVDSLKTAWSLKKLMGSNHANYVLGVMMYNDYQAARVALRQKGEYYAPKMVLK